jgi:hypothetical protein
MSDVYHDKRFARIYGMSPGQYRAMWAQQDGKCRICGSQRPLYGKGRLDIDHDHKDGKVRGLLCNPCNLGLSHFRDNSARLKEAMRYIEEAEATSSQYSFNAKVKVDIDAGRG